MATIASAHRWSVCSSAMTLRTSPSKLTASPFRFEIITSPSG